MIARLGIELSPVACRIVEIAGDAREGEETGVTSFAVAPPFGGGLADALRVVRGRRANVVIWNAASHHRQVVVADGPYERMRAEARAAARDVGIEIRSTLADIAPASPRQAESDRRTVLLGAASAGDVATALGPLRAAGIKVAAVLTPAAALLSLARLRRSLSAPAFEAYVALEETTVCAALVRDGMLLAARNLAWGYVEETGSGRAVRPREQIAAQLGRDLVEFVRACRLEDAALSQVSICGPLPELRSMAALLVEHLDVEVEPLDALFGIDPSALPGAADEFRDRAVELRLAWAAAADAAPPIDLFRAKRRAALRQYLARAAVAAGVASGLVAGWAVQSRWEPVDAPRQARRAQPALSGVEGPAPSGVEGPPPPKVEAVVRSEDRTALQPRQADLRPQPETHRAQAGPRIVQAPRLSRTEETPQPFDSALGTILYAADRKLAIIDGRIVGEGDVVEGARIVEITASAVWLRDARGRLRRLAGY